MADSKTTLLLLLWCSSILSTSLGYDSSMMSGLNILPSYSDYFELDTVSLALQSSVSWAGCAVAGLCYANLTDWLGRKKAMWISAMITLVGVILQAAAQNIAMFVVARFIVGIGNGATFVCGPVYLAEIFPLKWRGIGLALFMDFFYVGGLLSSGITYGTAKIPTTWAWRLPSILQALFMVLAVIVLPWVPESPRWLVYKDRHTEALNSIAVTQADGNVDDPVVLLTYQEILDTLHTEVEIGQKTNWVDLFKSKKSMRRLMLAASAAVISMVSGNNIVTFYLGAMLDNAGVTDTTTQLEIVRNLSRSLDWTIRDQLDVIGTFMLDTVGRRPLAIYSSVIMTVFLFLVGALTKVYGTSENASGVYGTVACIFLFQGFYSLGWTPLAMLYPPEVLNYSIRSVGMGVCTFLGNGAGLMVTMAFPIALDVIGWKTYMINGAWDVLQVVFIMIYWVETKGKTLEEIDELFDGPQAANAIHVQDVIEGRDPGLILKGQDIVVTKDGANSVLEDA